MKIKTLEYIHTLLLDAYLEKQKVCREKKIDGETGRNAQEWILYSEAKRALAEFENSEF